MGMFIQGRVAINEYGEVAMGDITPEMNVMFIRPKMDVGTKNKALGEAAKFITADQKKTGKTPRGKKAPKAAPEMDFDIGRYNNVLLQLNILDWQGPAFIDPHGGKIPCTSQNISQLDPDNPLVARVTQEIGERNKSAEEIEEEEAAELDDPNVLEGELGEQDELASTIAGEPSSEEDLLSLDDSTSN